MLGHLALSVAMAFVYGGSDADMARTLDDMNLGAKSGVGVVVAYGHGVTLRVPLQPLAGISGSSLGPLHEQPVEVDAIGALDVAIAELERLDETPKLLYLDEDAFANRSLFEQRARASKIEMVALPAMKRTVHVSPKPRPYSCPVLQMPRDLPEPAQPVMPWSSLGSLALLGLAAGLARRATV